MSISGQTCVSDRFTINGFASNVKAGSKIYIYYQNANVKTIDSATIVDGHFTLQGSLSYPGPATICNNKFIESTPKGASYVYLEPKSMEVKLDYRDFSSLKLDGSHTQNEMLELEHLKKTPLRLLDSISVLKREYFTEIEKNNVDSILIKNNIITLELQINDINKDLTKITFDYLQKHPTSFLTPYILYSRIRSKSAVDQYRDITSLYDNMSSSVKNSVPGMRLRDELENFKNIIIGKEAPDFVAKNINELNISLDDFRGKYVLLDFWASWCLPCRQDFPFLKKIYQDYHSKGFEIISISRDKNLESWRKAIVKDGIEAWQHVSIKQNVSNQDWLEKNLFEELYVVTAIPVKLLIDNNGVIIARWHGNTLKNKEELEKILSESF